MKTIKLFSTILLLSIALISCNKSDDDGGDNNNLEVGDLTAKINGSDFSGSVVASANQVNQNGTDVITILASDADGKAINIIINPFDGTGTYTFSDASVFTVASYTEADVNNPQNSQSWVAPYENSGVAGEVNISEKTDTNIKGTFNFKGKLQNGDSFKDITEGEFNLNISQF